MKILLVDDEENFREMMGDALEARGYDVVRAEDGKQAREAMENHARWSNMPFKM